MSTLNIVFLVTIHLYLLPGLHFLVHGLGLVLYFSIFGL